MRSALIGLCVLIVGCQPQSAPPKAEIAAPPKPAEYTVAERMRDIRQGGLVEALASNQGALNRIEASLAAGQSVRRSELDELDQDTVVQLRDWLELLTEREKANCGNETEETRIGCKDIKDVRDRITAIKKKLEG